MTPWRSCGISSRPVTKQGRVPTPPVNLPPGGGGAKRRKGRCGGIYRNRSVNPRSLPPCPPPTRRGLRDGAGTEYRNSFVTPRGAGGFGTRPYGGYGMLSHSTDMGGHRNAGGQERPPLRRLTRGNSKPVTWAAVGSGPYGVAWKNSKNCRGGFQTRPSPVPAARIIQTAAQAATFFAPSSQEGGRGAARAG